MNAIELKSTYDETFVPRGRLRSENDPLIRVTRSLSPRMQRVLDALSMGGVLTAAQLSVPLRSLKHYVHLRLLERVFLPQQVQEEWIGLFNLDRRELTHLRIFCLGPFGEQIARQRFPFAPLTGYLSYTPARILHDLILNEIVIRLAEAARQGGWRTFWAGTNAAEIRNGSEQTIEPDALLILEKWDERRLFAVEYHNEEDRRQRAFEKVRRYERAREKSTLWMNAWQVETFPSVLAIFRDNAVGLGYRDAVRELSAKGKYYVKSLDGVVKGNLQEWLNITNGSRESIF